MSAFVVICGYDADLQVKIVRGSNMQDIAQWLIDNMRDSTADETDLTTYTLAEDSEAALEEFSAIVDEQWSDYCNDKWVERKRNEFATWLAANSNGEWDSGEVVAG